MQQTSRRRSGWHLDSLGRPRRVQFRLLKSAPHRFYSCFWFATRWQIRAEVPARGERQCSMSPCCLMTASVIELAKRGACRRPHAGTCHGKPRALRHAIADHLGFSTRCSPPTSRSISPSHNKREKLVAEYGEKGFDYAGNSHDDIAVWQPLIGPTWSIRSTVWKAPLASIGNVERVLNPSAPVPRSGPSRCGCTNG